MIIVTGGAGFIGSAIVAELNRRGETNILIVDELGTDEKWKNLRKLHFTDYMEKDEFLRRVQNEEAGSAGRAIIHMGACSSTTEKDASFLIRNNYEYSKAMAIWAAKCGARFIYASSAATYGDGSLGFLDDESRISELVPLNMYGYSKQMFDLWAQKTGLSKSIVGIKYFNVYGPNEYHKADMRSFVNKAFLQIHLDGRVELFKSHRDDYEDGEQKRDFVYIKDAVKMTLFFLDKPEINGIFNVGTGVARSWNDLAKAVFSAMNYKENIKYVQMPDYLREKYQYFTQADISKIRQAGYTEPLMTMEDAVTDYVQNYLAKDEFLGGIL